MFVGLSRFIIGPIVDIHGPYIFIFTAVEILFVGKNHFVTFSQERRDCQKQKKKKVVFRRYNGSSVEYQFNSHHFSLSLFPSIYQTLCVFLSIFVFICPSICPLLSISLLPSPSPFFASWPVLITWVIPSSKHKSIFL